MSDEMTKFFNLGSPEGKNALEKEREKLAAEIKSAQAAVADHIEKDIAR